MLKCVLYQVPLLANDLNVQNFLKTKPAWLTLGSGKWIIKTDQAATDLYKEVSSIMPANTRLMVFDIVPGGSWVVTEAEDSAEVKWLREIWR